MIEETTVKTTLENARPTGEAAWRAVLEGTARLLENLGQALVTTAQDLSQLMIIRVDEDTREHLDMLVEAEVVKTRREAATYLLQAGIQAKREAFTHIAAARERIAALRAQLRESVQPLRQA